MPVAPRHPDRLSIGELVEDLRDEAVDLAQDLKGIPAEETTYGEAAQVLEELEAALTQIAGGTDDPKAVAAEALSLAAPLKPLAEPNNAPDDLIRSLLNPRRT